MSDLPLQFQNIYDRLKKKVVKKPGLIEAGELFKSCSKQLENLEHQSLCFIGASKCYQNCGEEVIQAKSLVAAADLLLVEQAGDQLGSRSASEAVSLYGRALDIYLHQDCHYLAYQLCLQAAAVHVQELKHSKAIPWLKKAVEIQTGSIGDQILATDHLFKACILEGEFQVALDYARRLEISLNSLNSSELCSFEKAVLSFKVTRILLYLTVESKITLEREISLLNRLRTFTESTFPKELAIDFSAFVVSLDEKDLETALEAEEKLQSFLNFEQMILVRRLIETKLASL